MAAGTASDDDLNVRLSPDRRCVAFVFGRAAEPAAGGNRISSDGLLVHCKPLYAPPIRRPLQRLLRFPRLAMAPGERACVFSRRAFAAVAVALAVTVAVTVAPVRAERQIVDLHRLDAYFALFANDSD